MHTPTDTLTASTAAAAKATSAAASLAAKAQGPLVIYHHNCADGFAAAWCFHHHHKLQVVHRAITRHLLGQAGFREPAANLGITQLLGQLPMLHSQCPAAGRQTGCCATLRAPDP